jgi:methionine-rich copper-binding protein CopC
MKKIKLLTTMLVMSTSLFTSNAILAHTELREAMPADGSVMHVGPEHLILNFTEEVRLLQLSVTDSNSQAVEIYFRASADAKATFSVMMPELSSDAYTVQWAVMGSDSHRVEGEFSFTVDPAVMESMGNSLEMPESHDAH